MKKVILMVVITLVCSGCNEQGTGDPIYVGDTVCAVWASQGKPHTVNRTVSKYGVREQWVYGPYGYGMRLFYFKDGILTGWQN